MTELDFWARFILAALGTWRLTHLLVHEDGPAGIIVRMRRRVGDGFFGRLLDCSYCASFWVAAPFAFFVCRLPLDRLIAWLAISGAACLLERLGGEPLVIERVPESGEKETDAMLRTTESGDEEGLYSNGTRERSEAARR